MKPTCSPEHPQNNIFQVADGIRTRIATMALWHVGRYITATKDTYGIDTDGIGAEGLEPSTT